MVIICICRKGGWDLWVMGGRSRKDGNNRLSERELDLLYAPKIFIIYHLSAAQKTLGLDFGPSFPVPGPVQLEARVPKPCVMRYRLRYGN
jgi:hypothetical protein